VTCATNKQMCRC